MRNLHDFPTRFQALETLGVDGFIAAAVEGARSVPEVSRSRNACQRSPLRPLREVRSAPLIPTQARKRGRATQR